MPQLGYGSIKVAFHRPFRQVQPCGYFVVAEAFGAAHKENPPLLFGHAVDDAADVGQQLTAQKLIIGCRIVVSGIAEAFKGVHILFASQPGQRTVA